MDRLCRSIPVGLASPAQRREGPLLINLWCVARDGHGRWKLEYSVRERE
jgi:hypothetical protein